VTEEEFELRDTEVTPRFPDGLTLLTWQKANQGLRRNGDQKGRRS